MDRVAQEVTPLGMIDYTYDAVGRRQTMQVTGQPVVNYTYDDAGRLTDIRKQKKGGQVYTLDKKQGIKRGKNGAA